MMFTSKFITVEFAILIFTKSKMILACPIIPWFPGTLVYFRLKTSIVADIYMVALLIKGVSDVYVCVCI